MYISGYPEGTPTITSSFLLNQDDTTKRIMTRDLLYGILNAMPPENRRLFFRGKNLGQSLTAAQKEAISSGTFSNLLLGDYWLIGGVHWRIWDFDYWYTGSGDHHVVIMPDEILYKTKYESVIRSGNYFKLEDQTVGYVLSAVKVSGMSAAVDDAEDAFGASALYWRDANMIANQGKAINYGATGAPKTDLYFPVETRSIRTAVDLPSDTMLYGCSVSLSYLTPDLALPVWFDEDDPQRTVDIDAIDTNGNGFVADWTVGYNGIVNNTSDQMQLALAKIYPNYVLASEAYMLRDMGALGEIHYVGTDGIVSSMGGPSTMRSTEEAYELGVRPVFGITGN